jgi:hypothetical protein
MIGANAKCQTHADAAGLDGKFRAWLATGPDDAPDTTWNWAHVPYVRVDGVLLFTFSGYFVGDLCKDGILDEIGVPHPGNTEAYLNSMTWMWMMTSWNGVNPTCEGWTGGGLGSAVTWDSCGGDNTGVSCAATAPIVCVEQ